MDLINNLIYMGIEGASLRETNAKFWDAVETLRLKNLSAAAVLDEAMRAGGKVRVEVDDRYATSTKTPRSSEPRSSEPTSLRVSAPKPSSKPSSRSLDKKPHHQSLRTESLPTPLRTLLHRDKIGERHLTAIGLELPYLSLLETAPPRK
jgi:hypothetical protein